MPAEILERLLPPPEPQLPSPVNQDGTLRAVVMAWPRSGTSWLRHAITMLGVNAGHESVYHHKGTRKAKRDIQVEVSGFCAPYTTAMGGLPRCLVVRNPQHLFGSIMKRWHGRLGPNPLPWICDRWCIVMRHLRQEADFVVRAEDLWANNDRVARMLLALGFGAVIKRKDIQQAERGQSTRCEIDYWRLTPDVRQLMTVFEYHEPHEPRDRSERGGASCRVAPA